MTLEVALQLAIAGLSTGSIYALVALGLVLAFKGTSVVNFAQGELVTLGAYIALFLSTLAKLSYPWVFVLTLLITGGVGIALERGLIRPLARAPAFTVVIATLAVGLMIKNVLRLSWQEQVSTIATPFGDAPLAVGSLRINPQYLWVIGCSLVLMAALAAFFRSSLVGKAMRAVAQNPVAAQLMGIRVNRMFAITFAISTMIAAVAGILVAPLIGIHAEMGGVILKAFVAAILGGFHSLVGAVIGGMLLGVLEVFGGAYFGGLFKETVAFVLLLLILLVRPHGLFGQAEARRV
ncbi:MAG: branched-chain amino acid ABC transporter permease [Pseudomonadota bacterium]